MNILTIKIGRLEIDLDKAKGARRRGWSVAWDGSYAVTYQHWLLIAVVQSWRKIRTWDKV